MSTMWEDKATTRQGGQSAIETLDRSASGEEPLIIKYPDSFESFLREQRALSDLRGDPRVVKLEYVEEDDRALYLAKAPGDPISELIRYEDFSEDEAALVIHEVAATLEFIHSYGQAGYVHYDVSPANIFWDRENQEVTVIDFGTAYKVDSIPADYSSQEIGTPLYMSPEKLLKQPEFGQAADMYALGAIWYEMLTGSPPFNPDIGNLKRQILNDEPLQLRQASPETNGMIMRLLDKTPGNRPVAAELRQWFEERQQAQVA